MIKW
jgi:hypothetical protein